MKIKLHVLKQKPIKLTILPQCRIGLRVEGEFYGNAPEYDGQYVIIPKFVDQTLDTSGKKLLDDVTVKEIPVVRTTNVQGGWTVLIGG